MNRLAQLARQRLERLDLEAAAKRIHLQSAETLITTEQLFTSKLGFGLETATPVQIAACRVRDGRPLGELRDDPDVIAAFGGQEAVEALPSERGIKPVEFYNVASARTAKTTLAVASALVDSQRLDLSGLAHGEVPRISIVSLKLDVADVPFQKLEGTIQASEVLRPLLIRQARDSVLVKHPSGRPVEIKVVAGSKAASGLVARWSGGLIADEAPRMSGREEAVANLDDVLSAVRERLLPGAQIQCIGSPWAPSGPVYDAVQEYFGRPTERIVVMRTTGPAGNPGYWTDELLEQLRAAGDEVAWRINALGEFIDPEAGLIDPGSVRRNTRETPLELPYDPSSRYAAAADPSGGGAGANGFSLVIVELPAWQDGVEARYRVALAREWRGERPEAIWRQIAECCHRYGLAWAKTDQFAADANADLARRYGLSLVVQPTTQASKVEDFVNLATVLHSDAIELPPNRTLVSDLVAVRKKTTQTGYTINLPKTSNGRHCDYAPSLASAIRALVTTPQPRDYDHLPPMR